MTKKIACFCLTAALATAAVALAGTDVYGEGVNLETTTPIADIVADPDAWNGKTVKVEGKVDGVCARKGCWIELANESGDCVRIKVQDDVIVFPQEAVGRFAVAQGTVEVEDMPRGQYVAWMKHVADEKGVDFDEASIGEGPHRFVQVMGTGAEIRTE